MITDKDGNKKLIPIVESAIQQNQPDQNDTPQNAEATETQSTAQQCNQNSAQPSVQVSTSAMPRKTGSLSIIFRKVKLQCYPFFLFIRTVVNRTFFIMMSD